MNRVRTLGVRLGVWRDRHLRFLVALLVGAASLGVLQVFRPAPTPTTPVLVAARALPAGTALTEQDVRVQALPSSLVVDGSLTAADQALAHRSATALSPGQPLTEAMLAPARQLPEGDVAIPVPVTAAEAAWLHPGDHVVLALNTSSNANVTSVSNGAPTVLGTVLAISTPTGANTPLMPTSGVSVLLQVRSQNVNEIARAARSSSLSVSLSA